MYKTPVWALWDLALIWINGMYNRRSGVEARRAPGATNIGGISCWHLFIDIGVCKYTARHPLFDAC